MAKKPWGYHTRNRGREQARQYDELQQATLGSIRLIHPDGTPVVAAELKPGHDYRVDPETGVVTHDRPKAVRKQVV